MTTHPSPENDFPPSASPGGAVLPIQERERLDALDLLRGLAILGILFVNMRFFTMPLAESLGPPGEKIESGADLFAWFFVKVFCELKFISMFSLLFGAGFMMQITRARQSGDAFSARYLRRLGLLAVFGLIHALVFWYGDILFIYAVVGLLLLPFARATARTLLLAGIGVVLAAALFGTTCMGLQALGESMQSAEVVERTVEAAPRGFAAMGAASLDPHHPVWIEAETHAYREGPFGDAMVFRAVSYFFALVMAVLVYGWHVLAMFLLGAGLMKSGFFAPGNQARQMRLALLGIVIGLPLSAMGAMLWYYAESMMDWRIIVASFIGPIGAAALCLGYVGLGSLIAGTRRLRGVLAPVRAVGRTALTTYLGSTLLATFLMYHWGLGWFGEVGYFEQWLLTLAIYAVLLIAATIWLKFFRFGPFEWIWRCATYLRVAPLLASREAGESRTP